jgi:hypothetical protein
MKIIVAPKSKFFGVLSRVGTGYAMGKVLLLDGIGIRYAVKKKKILTPLA